MKNIAASILGVVGVFGIFAIAIIAIGFYAAAKVRGKPFSS